MKLSDIAKNLANRINQEHYIEHELKKVFETAYKLGFEEANKQAQALQLQQTGVSTCFLEDYEDHFFEVKYKQVSCCKIAPITNENYCPNCGNKILK